MPSHAIGMISTLVAARASAISPTRLRDEQRRSARMVCVASVYSFPEYYDILFGWDRSYEAQTYVDVLACHGVEPGCSVLEVAAGTAQVGKRLARDGFSVTALDSSEAMLAFAVGDAERQRVTIERLVADMTAFEVVDRFHAAINPMSSFRLLLSDADAGAHLTCMGHALLPRGVYVIDMSFGTDGSAESDLDEWVMERDGITVPATTSCVRVFDPMRGAELILDWHESLRSYTSESFARLVDRNDQFSVAGCYREVGVIDDISRFSGDLDQELPDSGRALVVLARA